MPLRRFILLVILLPLLAPKGAAQQSPAPADSAAGEVRTVLRAYYYNLASQNWDGLAAYVLSPKLLERRGVAADSQLALRDRERQSAREHAVAPPANCPSKSAPMIDAAVIHVDRDWADASVPRCDHGVAGVDEFGLIYFEQHWRFIYTDLFSGSPDPTRH